MAETKPTILVAGDITLDWFTWPVPAEEEGENWRLHDQYRTEAQPGGAALLERFIGSALRESRVEAEVIGPRLHKQLRGVLPTSILHSNAILAAVPREHGSKDKVLRVERAMGYVGPRSGPAPVRTLRKNPDAASMIVLDDAGNGLRFREDRWPKALVNSDDPPVVIHKLCRPLRANDLVKSLLDKKLEKYIVVINARDLRASDGVQISRSVSWERTAREFAYQLERADALKRLEQCPYVVVLFGTDGAIVRVKSKDSTTLVYDPKRLEGSFAANVEGSIYGLTSAFAAALAAKLSRLGVSHLASGVADGLAAMRRLLLAGYSERGQRVYLNEKGLFRRDDQNEVYQYCSVPRTEKLDDADPSFWRILDQETRHTRNLVAEEIVKCKKARGLDAVPVGAFGKLQTIDRAEIESYSAIRELIVEFLANPRPPRPLSFAVFGPPGAGKSFGVKQVLKSIGDDSLVPRTFNVSQFSGYEDLVAAFHQVRDLALAGKVPFVFFDEFDSSLGETQLGWLKYFLAPMQDGEFKDGESSHPVGKAVFVFAGGTRSTYESFEANLTEEEFRLRKGVPDEKTKANFRARKGPDFVSRLRGFINIMGPNRQVSLHDDDEAFIIRRAKVLRVLLGLNPKASGLFSPEGNLKIDEGVLRALLHVSAYRHGTRSLEAVIDMSRLAGANRFDLSSLPPRPQLELHVDADEFLRLSSRPCYQSMLPRSTWVDDTKITSEEDELTVHVARGLHESYLHELARTGKDTKDEAVFDNLLPEGKESNLDLARFVPFMLRSINHGMRRISGKYALTPDISDKEVDDLAQLAHERFCRERRLKGYTYGKGEKNEVLRTHPDLVPYRDLDDEKKGINRAMVRALPGILAKHGFELFRMQEHLDISEQFIEQMARTIHANYARNEMVRAARAARAAEAAGAAGAGAMVEATDSGEVDLRPDDTPPLVDANGDPAFGYDQLLDHKKESNRDNARSIPRKLRMLDIGIRPRREDEEPRDLKFEPKSLEMLAKMEHARWCWQKIIAGWSYESDAKDDERKVHEDLIPWAELSEEARKKDLDTVKLIPVLLHEAGYQTYPMHADHP